MNTPTPCPCGSGQPDDTCCSPFLNGRAQPDTAEQLMRARYTAFVRQNANYLFATLLPSKREKNELKSLTKSFRGVRWVRLEVLGSARGGASDDEGTVEFRATLEAGGQQRAMREKSTFQRKDGRWFYVDGEMSEVPSA